MSIPGKQLRNDMRGTSSRPARRHARAVSTSRLPVTEPLADAPRARRWLTPRRVFFAVSALIVYLGWRMPTQHYITPESGLGYWLGIIGGSMMLLLILYSVRKRVRWLATLGSLPVWFEAHLVLGVVGPILILFHSNFALGATNSNVTLFCMLIVVASGFVGRYIYSHVHHGLYGRRITLAELQAGAERMRKLDSSITFLPELLSRMEACEAQLLASGPRLPVLDLAKPLVVAVKTVAARWRLRRYVRKSLRVAALKSPALAAQRKRLRRAAAAYINRRLIATRRLAAFESFQQLFSLWYVLHVPMIFVLVIAGIVHVIAVHVY